MPFCYPLCSSSKGNATYFGTREAGVLIDIGLSARQLFSKLSLASIERNAIRAIFITHEHSDHIKGLPVAAKQLNVPIYGSRKTLEALIEKDMIPAGATVCEIKHKSAEFAGLSVSAFETPHDAAHSLGYRVTLPDGRYVCTCTDLGHMTEEIYDRLKGSELVLLESNYDPQMLEDGPYPSYLKRRIASSHGHLSNEDCANTVASLFADGTTRFLLGHLSEQNNRPELAYFKTISALSKAGAVINEDVSLMVAPPQNCGKVIAL